MSQGTQNIREAQLQKMNEYKLHILKSFVSSITREKFNPSLKTKLLSSTMLGGAINVR